MPNSISDDPRAEHDPQKCEPGLQQDHAAIKNAIRARALAEGFDAIAFAEARAPDGGATALYTYLANNYHGTMDWLENRADARSDPRILWPEARSAILLAVNYGPDKDPLAVLADRSAGAISVYARGDDYHEVVKKKLKSLAGFVAQQFGSDVKVFVDTAPLMEKPLAHAAGLGWQGKHTNLVSREFGSWLFLGSILTTLALEPDAPEPDHCGHCRKCLDICPTNAFPQPYEIDARRCISYLTIEHKGHIPREFRVAIANRIYGCDDCLAVCPWNKFARAASEMKLKARAGLERPTLAALARLDDAAFRALFRKSAVKRIGRDRFVRNVLIAIGNSGEAGLAQPARERLGDASSVVRVAAIWALSRLLDETEFAVLARTHAPDEPDMAVRQEWVISAPA